MMFDPRVVAAALATTVLLPAVARAQPTPPGSLTHPLQAVGACSSCHAFPNPSGDEDEPLYAPHLWQGSMMANAGRDPVFWAGVAIAHQDDPEGTEDCVRCHAPRAFLEGRGDAIAMDELQPQDLEGITCDLCHRMKDDGMTVPGNARYVIDDDSDIENVPKRGPWSYAADAEIPHEWIQDPYLGESAFCGVCHDVTTTKERVDDEGNGLGVLFGEQRTYSEWANSAYAQTGADFRSCQDCHMPALTDVAGCSMWAGVQTHPTGGRRHDLVGANRFVLELLRDLYGSAGSGLIADVYFDHSLERMDELLATAADLTIDAPDNIDVGIGFDLDVTVTNNTGHKLPTGYSEGRVMWLEVVARYGDEILWESGRWQDDGTMGQDDQLRTYQGIAEDHTDGTQLHLLRNDRWVEDTRIPPRGLTPNLETDPVGERYTLQLDGTWSHFDEVQYSFAGRTDVTDQSASDPEDDRLDLTIRLLYLINTSEYIEFLADTNETNDAGTQVASLFENRGGAQPLVLAEQVLSIPLQGFSGGDSSTGGTDSTDSDSDAGDPPNPSDDGPNETDTTDDGDTTETNENGASCRCTAEDPSRSHEGLPWSLLPILTTLRRPRTPPDDKRRLTSGNQDGTTRWFQC